jgi:hypothetical protein
MMTTVRSRLTFANVTASLALFVALGGTGYAAAKLPRNSVGSSQIRTHAVRSAELANGAVSSRSIHNGTIQTTDLSAKAQASLRGQTGPAGPPGASGVTLRASVPSGGTVAAGNAVRATHVGGTNEYSVEFAQDLTNCIPTATLAAVRSGPSIDEPDAGRITVGVSGVAVQVKTYAENGSQAERPFNVVVAC